MLTYPKLSTPRQPLMAQQEHISSKEKKDQQPSCSFFLHFIVFILFYAYFFCYLSHVFVTLNLEVVLLRTSLDLEHRKRVCVFFLFPKDDFFHSFLVLGLVMGDLQVQKIIYQIENDNWLTILCPSVCTLKYTVLQSAGLLRHAAVS